MCFLCCLCCVQLEAAPVASGGLLGVAGVDAEGGQAFVEVDVVRVSLSGWVVRAGGGAKGERRKGEREEGRWPRNSSTCTTHLCM